MRLSPPQIAVLKAISFNTSPWLAARQAHAALGCRSQTRDRSAGVTLYYLRRRRLIKLDPNGNEATGDWMLTDAGREAVKKLP